MGKRKNDNFRQSCAWKHAHKPNASIERQDSELHLLLSWAGRSMISQVCLHTNQNSRGGYDRSARRIWEGCNKRLSGYLNEKIPGKNGMNDQWKTHSDKGLSKILFAGRYICCALLASSMQSWVQITALCTADIASEVNMQYTISQLSALISYCIHEAQ